MSQSINILQLSRNDTPERLIDKTNQNIRMLARKVGTGLTVPIIPAPDGDDSQQAICVITEDMALAKRNTEYGTAPWNTSYRYTDILVDLPKDLLVEGFIICFVCKTKANTTTYQHALWIDSGTYRNVRVKFGEDDVWHPLMTTTAVAVGSTYLTNVQYRLWVYRTDQYENGAFHLLTDTDSNTYTTCYCTTAATTAAKAASLSSGKLSLGYNTITFAYDNTKNTAITLNVNSTGAKPLYINGNPSGPSNYAFQAGTYMLFYDGTNYYIRTDGKLSLKVGNDMTTVQDYIADVQAGDVNIEAIPDTYINQLS